MKICDNHPEYKVPLIWTFAFRSCEYWCPFCGFTGGMMGSGHHVGTTYELKRRYVAYKKFSNDFLHATGVQVCVSTEWEGKQIPPDELPDHEHQRLQKIRDEWKYGVEIESVKY